MSPPSAVGNGGQREVYYQAGRRQGPLGRQRGQLYSRISIRRDRVRYVLAADEGVPFTVHVCLIKSAYTRFLYQGRY